jgi:hypothetical protein
MNSQTCAQRFYDLIFKDLNNALNIKSIIIDYHHLLVETGKVRSVRVAGWH